MKKPIIFALLALLLVLPLPVSAHPVPDGSMDGHCSITITMRHQGKALPGGTISLYKVGYVHENDGNYSFRPVAAVRGTIPEFKDIQSPALASELAQLTLPPVTPTPVAVDWRGNAAFIDLDFGLYLVVQKTAPRGFELVRPFLGSVPCLNGDTYLYHVTGLPKTAPESRPTPAPPPSSGRLAQTGQLWWPVPVLVCGGLSAIAVGLFRRRRGQS